jgi:hypothetical protein
LPGEPLAFGLQPCLVGDPRPTDDGVEEAGVKASSLVTLEIDHDGDRPIKPDTRRPPNVLIYLKGGHILQPGRVGNPSPRFDLDGVPSRVCQSTPSCRASADTVVSSELSALVAHATARVVSTIRDGAMSCASLKV